MKKNKKKFRKGVFGLTYCKNPEGKIEYALLKRKKHWIGWEFVKGKIEKGETKEMAVRREVKEETGLKILNIKKFNVGGFYKYNKKLKDRPRIIGQTYVLFAVKIKRGKIKVDKKEHERGEWVSFKEAYRKLTWPNQRKCLKIVDNWLKNEMQGN